MFVLAGLAGFVALSLACCGVGGWWVVQPVPPANVAAAASLWSTDEGRASEFWTTHRAEAGPTLVQGAAASEANGMTWLAARYDDGDISARERIALISQDKSSETMATLRGLVESEGVRQVIDIDTAPDTFDGRLMVPTVSFIEGKPPWVLERGDAKRTYALDALELLDTKLFADADLRTCRGDFASPTSMRNKSAFDSLCVVATVKIRGRDYPLRTVRSKAGQVSVAYDASLKAWEAKRVDGALDDFEAELGDRVKGGEALAGLDAKALEQWSLDYLDSEECDRQLPRVRGIGTPLAHRAMLRQAVSGRGCSAQITAALLEDGLPAWFLASSMATEVERAAEAGDFGPRDRHAAQLSSYGAAIAKGLEPTLAGTGPGWFGPEMRWNVGLGVVGLIAAFFALWVMGKEDEAPLCKVDQTRMRRIVHGQGEHRWQCQSCGAVKNPEGSDAQGCCGCLAMIVVLGAFGTLCVGICF
jgi:hypothetical protein